MNYIKYSEQFDNAQWGKSSGVIVTPNAALAPDGTMTADYIQFSAANKLTSQFTSTPVGTSNVTFSVFVKGTAGETIQIGMAGMVDAKHTLNGEWQRISGYIPGAIINPTCNINTYGGATARNVYIWGYQVEVSATATPYQKTESSPTAGAKLPYINQQIIT